MNKIYRPNEFAKLIGKSVQTLQRWDREGKLKAKRSFTNRRYYTHEQYIEYFGQRATPDKKNVVYCRVMHKRQRHELENQKKAIETFCISKGLEISEWLVDTGSGLDYQRRSFLILMEMIERGEVGTIVVAHQDRLVRFGFELFERFCENHGAKIIVMNHDSLSPKDEIGEDLLFIINHFSIRLDVLKKYKNFIKEVVSEKVDKGSQEAVNFVLKVS
jgi:predicted site-specific integrase-resolvase